MRFDVGNSLNANPIESIYHTQRSVTRVYD